jgi:TPR repeat protein
LPNVTGIGNEAAAAWSTPVRTVQIGDETIQNGSLEIIYSRGRETEDLVLGQDFLRTHRVLFALAQKKLYLSYRGGSVFTRDAGLPPWIREEAENGNADAQYALVNRYANGYGVPRDAAQARTWLEKAAAAGQPNANMQLGMLLLRTNQVAAAVPKLRAALDLLPSDKYLPLWLYLARVRNGEAELAQQELASSYMASKEEVWPEPVARFYLGKLDADGLLTHARYADNEPLRHALTCSAKDYMGSWYEARGDKARSASLRDAWNKECKTVTDAAGSSKSDARQ